MYARSADFPAPRDARRRRGLAEPLTTVILLALMVFQIDSKPQSPASVSGGDSQSSRPFQISVNLDLVTLPVTVRDKQGAFVSDLGEQDFEISEDGVRQAIRLFRREDVPVTVGLVVDHSGSMRQKLPDVMTAAESFVQSSNKDDQMFVVNFNEHVSLGLPPAIRFTNRADQLGSAILRVPAAGQTALYDAVALALDRLRAGERDKKVLIVISDGGDNASALGFSGVLKKAEESNVLIYTVGIFDDDDPDRNPAVLRRLARVTGGEAYFPGQPNDVAEICRRIAIEIRNQYVLGYVSANTAKPGTYRAVQVVARAPGRTKLTARTRSGYIAGSEVTQ